VNTVDPLGGSYFVEALTNDMERDARSYFDRIDELGGVIPALEGGFQQREIAEAAYTFQREVDTGERTIVGVNDFQIDEPIEIPILRMDPAGERVHLDRLNRIRAERDDEAVRSTLAALDAVCRDGKTNTMPAILDAVRAYATLGEICGVMREAFGEYQERLVV
jgi:methylmalonyl-CoA mutase N-terminal domain/subunit